jgi:hypothetical protein
MMLRRYHIEMLHLALDDTFSPRALEKIIAANIHQDRPLGQIGHDEYHFDNNAFKKSYAYIEEQRALAVASLMAHQVPAAWAAFGRLTHTAQDFYAHSNYIDLWLAHGHNGARPAPPEVEPMEAAAIHSSALRSGKVYWIEILTLIPLLRPLIMPVLPRDAHGWMNLDAPERGPNFKYAFQAAVKRTRIEFEKTTKALPQDLVRLFLDR